MGYQEIRIHFSSIKFEGEEAAEATKMILADDLWLTRENDEEHEEDDEEQTVMLTDLSSSEDRMIIEDTLEDEIEGVLGVELEYFKLVDYEIDWAKSEICH